MKKREDKSTKERKHGRTKGLKDLEWTKKLKNQKKAKELIEIKDDL